MINWISGTLGGFAILLALNSIAPADRLNLAEQDHALVAVSANATVNRANKGDRLVQRQAVRDEANSTASGKSPSKASPAPKMPVGCEPVFSPLSVSARLNTTGRCLS